MLFRSEKHRSGTLKIKSNQLNFITDIPEHEFAFEMIAENEFSYSERIGTKNHLYIVGGGHCALALSKLMSGMGFYIHLIEEREDLNTLLKNDFVHEKIIVSDYAEIEDLIARENFHSAEGGHAARQDSYIVIMTFGYRTDNIAVRALAGKNFRYLGVLGSGSKMQELFEEWEADGISESWLKNIHAPIGIPIHSETPEEIAVSIAAEIIKIKNSKVIF